jgi:hypothetical protein
VASRSGWGWGYPGLGHWHHDHVTVVAAGSGDSLKRSDGRATSRREPERRRSVRSESESDGRTGVTGKHWLPSDAKLQIELRNSERSNFKLNRSTAGVCQGLCLILDRNHDDRPPSASGCRAAGELGPGPRLDRGTRPTVQPDSGGPEPVGPGHAPTDGGFCACFAMRVIH